MISKKILSFVLPIIGWFFQLVASYVVSVFYCHEVTQLHFHIITLIGLILSLVGLYLSIQIYKKSKQKIIPAILISFSSLVIIIIWVSDLANIFIEGCL